MVKEIAANIIFVTGAVRSAIYDFNTKKVYSITPEGTKSFIDILTHPDKTGDDPFSGEIKTIFNVEDFKTNDYIFPQKTYDLHFAWLELTQLCNFRCLHCYEGSLHKEVESPLSAAEWKAIISDLFNNNCRCIQFIGGEPSIVPFLPELISYCHDIGMTEITVFTNLFRISPQLLHCIIENNVQVKFSIYGASPETHDAITQVPGSFECLLRSIALLQEKGVRLNANVVIMKENEEEYDNIIGLLKNIGIQTWHFDEIRKVYGGTQNKHLPQKPRKIFTTPNFKITKKQFDEAGSFNTCWYGKLVVSTDGAVYPCEFERGITYGNIRDNTIHEILNGETLRKHWSFTFDNVEFCKCCEYRFACRDCRPLAYAERGCISDQNPRCKYNPLTGVWENE